MSGNVGRPSPLPPLPDLNAALTAQAAATPAAIPLLVQCLDYATLRPDALSAGLLTVQGGQLNDVPGRAQSPYLLRKLFAVAPATTVSPTGNVSFLFAPSLHVHNGGTGTSTVQALSLDFGDGCGYLPVAWNTPISAQYCAAGTQRVKVRATYGKGIGTTYESWFDLYVQEGSCNAARYDQSDAAKRPKRFAATNAHAGGIVYVRLGGNRTTPGDTTIRRPLIVAEGYDGFSAAPAVYRKNYGIQDFLNYILDAQRNTTLYYDLQTAVDATGDPTGYDIIFIDYHNGTDDIRRNAALFEEVVRWVNDTKVGGVATGAENVVLGVSMGGLVARYGLAEMVKNPMLVNGVNKNNPHTRLLITHDSPHRGANTPLGIQLLVRQAAGTVAGQYIRYYNNTVNSLPHTFPALALLPELQQADDILDTPATQQLLVVRSRRFGVGPQAQFATQYNSFLDTDYRAMITPDAGQTFPYRFIATSLGSQCGNALFAPHTELIRVERNGYLGIFGLTTGYNTEIIVNALPAGGQVERISSLRLWNETHILGISLGRIYLANYSFHSPSNNPKAWDGLPSGTQAIAANVAGAGQLAQGSSYVDNISLIFVWGSGSVTYLGNKFCFVPRASALDVVTLDPASLTGPYINGLVGGNGSASRTENFIAQASFFKNGQEFNEEHPFFPAGRRSGCSTRCRAPQIRRPALSNATRLALKPSRAPARSAS